VRCTGPRGERDKATCVTNLALGDQVGLPTAMGELGLNGTMTGKDPKLELGQALIKAEWGRLAR
jgi:hypothetical protein